MSAARERQREEQQGGSERVTNVRASGPGATRRRINHCAGLFHTRFGK
ncbi:Hypothetical protein AA314_09420 [Archangium gephyra]|uniref:Uncharacterized protein n=1 Tax=Archangium gephyra TaxID=48 RepID=A0AAC8QI74_9BACT|nr:Hypothetical protein AA314_09420 [Archangium gephyra]